MTESSSYVGRTRGRSRNPVDPWTRGPSAGRIYFIAHHHNYYPFFSSIFVQTVYLFLRVATEKLQIGGWPTEPGGKISSPRFGLIAISLHRSGDRGCEIAQKYYYKLSSTQLQSEIVCLECWVMSWVLWQVISWQAPNVMRSDLFPFFIRRSKD